MKRPQVSQAGYRLTERNTQDDGGGREGAETRDSVLLQSMKKEKERQREREREGKREVGREREIKCSWGVRCDLIQLTKVLRFHKCTIEIKYIIV